jgi:hypothetical protein
MQHRTKPSLAAVQRGLASPVGTFLMTSHVSHVPPAQRFGVSQTRPQAPQLLGSVAVSTQRPLQYVRPPAQVPVQVPAMHAGPVAPEGVGQT